MIESAGFWVALTVTLTCGDVTTPDAADAVLMTLPVSMSACATEYVPVQITDPPGAKPAAGSAGQLTAAILLSVTVIAVVSVVLPVLVTL